MALLALLFIGGGLIAFSSLPIEAFPDVSDIQVNVVTLYPGRAAEEVEKQVTIPLELASRAVCRTACGCSRTRSSACRSSCSPSTTRSTTTSRASRCSSACRRADCPNGVHAAARAALDADRRDLSLSAARPRAVADRSAHARRTGRSTRYLQADARRRRHRDDGRLVKQYEVNPDLAQTPLLQHLAAATLSPRSAAATRTPAAATSSRARSSIWCAASACCDRPTTSATSSSRRAMERRFWSTTSRT